MDEKNDGAALLCGDPSAKVQTGALPSSEPLETHYGYGAWDWLDELADAADYSGRADQAWAREIRDYVRTLEAWQEQHKSAGSDRENSEGRKHQPHAFVARKRRPWAQGASKCKICSCVESSRNHQIDSGNQSAPSHSAPTNRSEAKEDSSSHHDQSLAVRAASDAEITQVSYAGRAPFMCLWLRWFPRLRPTNVLTPPAKGTDEHKRWSLVHREPPGPNRAKNRSRTFPGIAEAMADQWGALKEWSLTA